MATYASDIEAWAAALVATKPVLVIATGAPIAYFGLQWLRKTDRQNKYGVALRFVLLGLGILNAKIYFEYGMGFNGGKNPFADSNGNIWAAVIFVEYFFISFISWSIPLLFILDWAKMRKDHRSTDRQ